MSKVIIIQRICPHYRIPVFENLSKIIDMTLFYGKGEPVGSNQNVPIINTFDAKRVFSLSISLQWGERNYYLSVFPFIVFAIIKNRPRAVITEGSTNILNNIMVVPLCKILKIPIIWWDAGRDVKSRKNLLRTITEPIISYLIKKADACIAYGERAKCYYKNIGVISDKIFIAQNTTNISKDDNIIENKDIENEKSKLGIMSKKIILYVGAIEKRNKIGNLIEAFRIIREQNDNVALIIIGDGHNVDAIKKIIINGDQRDIYLLGRIVENIGIYFSLANMLVLPGWSSLAIIQAMNSGIPVITVPYGGPEYEMVKSGETGIIISEDSVKELSEAIKKLLDNDDMAKMMGRKGKEAMEYVTVENMANSIKKAVEYTLKV